VNLDGPAQVQEGYMNVQSFSCMHLGLTERGVSGVTNIARPAKEASVVSLNGIDVCHVRNIFLNEFHVTHILNMTAIYRSGIISYINIVTCRGGLHMTYKTYSGLDDWINCSLYIHTTHGYRLYSGIADPHTAQFTVTYPLGFSTFTSRILATDL
jgi:hypothetical protein